MQPAASLPGAPPRVSARLQATLSNATLADIARRLGAQGRPSVQGREIAGQRVAEVMHRREVDITGLSEKLNGEGALAGEPVRVGVSGAHPAILGAMPQPDVTVDEVRTFAAGLVARDAIATEGEAAGASVVSGGKTHAVVVENGQRVLRRVCFACRCCL